MQVSEPLCIKKFLMQSVVPLRISTANRFYVWMFYTVSVGSIHKYQESTTFQSNLQT